MALQWLRLRWIVFMLLLLLFPRVFYIHKSNSVHTFTTMAVQGVSRFHHIPRGLTRCGLIPTTDSFS